MKTKHQQKHFHQYIEAFSRHEAMLGIVVGIMFFGLVCLDGRMRHIMQEAYAEGFAWVGTYLHHEHPAHQHGGIAAARIPTISGAG